MNNITTTDPQAAYLPLRRDLPCRLVGNEAFVRDPETGQVHFLNAAAALVWQCCDGATSLQECNSRLRSAFFVPDSTDTLADISNVLENFRRLGILHG